MTGTPARGCSSGTLRINGVDIYYELADFTDPWAEPQTVLLHHGFCRNLRFWYQWIPLLCRNFRVLTFDSRGFGRSPLEPGQYHFTPDDMIADAIGLMDALGIDRVHWGAEASGGIVGVATALKHPDRVASITACNTPFKIPAGFLDMFVEAEVREHGLGYWANKTLKSRVNVDKVPPGWVAWTTHEFEQVPAELAIALHQVWKGADMWALLPQVQTPVLILVGDSSTIATRDDMLSMSKRLPRGELVVFDGYGQGVAFMIPERCTAEMQQFIARVVGGAH